ncbi:MAG: glutathione S-transferase family protein [Rhodospirillaceae bacterium]|nr:glutathione S-transferase family protein [Rhodospirillaceae bacterium]
MKIELYYAPITCAMAPFIALTEAGAEFEVHALNFRTNEHLTPEYRKINPKHKVPMLVVDGRRMTENVAIHLWVSRTFPDAKLIPADPWEQAQTVSLLSWCSGGIHPYLSRVNNPAKVCATDGSADSIIAKATAALEENFAIANELLEDRDYLMGNFTSPDAHFFWCTRRATQFKLDMSAFPNVMAHFERMQTRPSVQKLLAFEKETIEGFKLAAA